MKDHAWKDSIPGDETLELLLDGARIAADRPRTSRITLVPFRNPPGQPPPKRAPARAAAPIASASPARPAAAPARTSHPTLPTGMEPPPRAARPHQPTLPTGMLTAPLVAPTFPRFGAAPPDPPALPPMRVAVVSAPSKSRIEAIVSGSVGHGTAESDPSTLEARASSPHLDGTGPVTLRCPPSAERITQLSHPPRTLGVGGAVAVSAFTAIVVVIGALAVADPSPGAEAPSPAVQESAPAAVVEASVVLPPAPAPLSAQRPTPLSAQVPTPRAALPDPRPGQGRLIASSPFDAEVYANGKQVGRVNEPFELRCGLWFLRLAQTGTSRHPAWLAPGKTTRVLCQVETQLEPRLHGGASTLKR